jgi:NADPH:quinone reductase-like Zn-dependent oxidoreductase
LPVTLPETMTCIEIAAPGGPEVLRPATRPVPPPAAGEVLVRVAAAGVNRPDVLQREGGYAPPPGASDIPGLELAGTVVALGPEVDGPAVGDQVCALVAGGGYAEYCPVPAPLALPLPTGFDMVMAAAVPEWCMAGRAASAPPRSSSPAPSAPPCWPPSATPKRRQPARGSGPPA